MKLVINYVLEWMGLNFQYYDGLQQKIRAGIINEHECNHKNTMVMWLFKIFGPHCVLLMEEKRVSISGDLSYFYLAATVV